MAETRAMASPRMSSEGGLEGNDDGARTVSVGGLGEDVVVFVIVVVSGDGVSRSAREMMMMPASEARTPRSFRSVNRSVRVKAPIKRVQIEEVDVRIVVEATVVCWRQAKAK